MKERRKSANAKGNRKAAPGADGKMSASSAELGKKRLEKARAAETAEENDLTEEQLARLERARQKAKESYGAK